MARTALQRLGYRVIEAVDGADALERWREHRSEIDLVILDLTMPVMSGEETLRRLRAAAPSLPVILSSGFNEREATRRIEEGNLAGFLQKPYSLKRLDECLQSALGTRTAHT
jgi:CheY-like chemotaxis protein